MYEQNHHACDASFERKLVGGVALEHIICTRGVFDAPGSHGVIALPSAPAPSLRVTNSRKKAFSMLISVQLELCTRRSQLLEHCCPVENLPTLR